MDTWKGTIDMPESMEADTTPPMHYVIAVDESGLLCLNKLDKFIWIDNALIFFLFYQDI